MTNALDKWQATAVVMFVILAVLVLALKRPVNTDTVIAGLFGISGLVLGAGAVAHGVRQGSKAAVEPPAGE